jgi:hypothetical protein
MDQLIGGALVFEARRKRKRLLEPPDLREGAGA